LAELSHKSIIESRRLLYFFYVAKHGSFSRAEGVLDAPQPVISRQIAKLEDELGVQLLDRNGRGVTLTPFGEILLRHAETILREMGNAISELDIAKRKPAGQVRLAAPATFMTLYMPEILRRFMEELPDVELVIAQLLTGEIYERLVSDYIDIGIVHSVPNKTRFEVRELLVEPMVCLVEHNHALAGTCTIARSDLADQRLAVPSSAHGLRGLIDSYMAAGDISFTPHVQIDSVPLIREVVAEGQMATILPQSTAALEFNDGRFVALNLRPTFKRSLFVAHFKDARNKAIVDAMVHHISAVVNERTSALTGLA
jgi:LysR family nitrogen assimilation transcriptional regulator